MSTPTSLVRARAPAPREAEHDSKTGLDSVRAAVVSGWVGHLDNGVLHLDDRLAPEPPHGAIGLLRALMLNHWYHHRGQLSVYLRLLDVPVPSIYGPSADENPFA